MRGTPKKRIAFLGTPTRPYGSEPFVGAGLKPAPTPQNARLSPYLAGASSCSSGFHSCCWPCTKASTSAGVIGAT